MRRSNTPQEIRCTFCGRSKEEIKALVAGPSVYICNDCIGLCVEMLPQNIYSSHPRSRLLEVQRVKPLTLGSALTAMGLESEAASQLSLVDFVDRIYEYVDQVLTALLPEDIQMLLQTEKQEEQELEQAREELQRLEITIQHKRHELETARELRRNKEFLLSLRSREGEVTE